MKSYIESKYHFLKVAIALFCLALMDKAQLLFFSKYPVMIKVKKMYKDITKTQLFTNYAYKRHMTSGTR